MKMWKCDECGQELYRRHNMVSIKGYCSPFRGCKLIATDFLEFDFCDRGCFERWLRPKKEEPTARE